MIKKLFKLQEEKNKIEVKNKNKRDIKTESKIVVKKQIENIDAKNDCQKMSRANMPQAISSNKNCDIIIKKRLSKNKQGEHAPVNL